MTSKGILPKMTHKHKVLQEVFSSGFFSSSVSLLYGGAWGPSVRLVSSVRSITPQY